MRPPVTTDPPWGDDDRRPPGQASSQGSSKPVGLDSLPSSHVALPAGGRQVEDAPAPPPAPPPAAGRSLSVDGVEEADRLLRRIQVGGKVVDG